MIEGFQLSIANVGAGWEAHVRVQEGDRVIDRRDKGQTMDHAAALAVAQLQAWIEKKKGLPPGGAAFGKPKKGGS